MSTVTTGADVTPVTPQAPARGLGVAAGAALALFASMFGTWTPESPEVGRTDAAGIRAWAADAAGTLQLNAFAGVLAIVALLVLTAALAGLVRQAAPNSVLGGLTLLGGGLLAAINTVVTGFTLLWVLPDLAALDDATVQTWYATTHVGQMLGEIAVVTQSLLMGAFSLAALRGGIVARWLCWLGIVLAAVGLSSVLGLIVPSPVFQTTWLVGLYAWVLWPLLASIAFAVRLRRGRR
ncbi:hypothetical protein ABZV78_23075 [Micromonospora sp. NPDC004540]|uniref:hypothetical protein n=1 Tax=Micromonospora sp. NPDC004540 TaxID=3154457 RepID=UPI0033BBDACD